MLPSQCPQSPDGPMGGLNKKGHPSGWPWSVSPVSQLTPRRRRHILIPNQLSAPSSDQTMMVAGSGTAV